MRFFTNRGGFVNSRQATSHQRLSKAHKSNSRRFESLEDRRLLSVTATRTGSAPNFDVTFVDDSSAIVDNQLFLRFNGAGQLEWRTFAGSQTTFTNDLDTSAVGTQTAPFAEIANLYTFMGVGSDTVEFQLTTFSIGVTAGAGPGTSTVADLTDLDGAAGSFHAHHEGLEILRYTGVNESGQNDDLTVRPIQLNALNSFRVGASPQHDGRVSSDGPTNIDFANLRDFTFLEQHDFSKSVVTFDSVGYGAQRRHYIGADDDTLIIEGGNATDDQWEVYPGSANNEVRIDHNQFGTILAQPAEPNKLFTIIFRGQGGNDQVEVDTRSGAQSRLIQNRIVFDGGAGVDNLLINGTPNVEISRITYRPGVSQNTVALDYVASTFPASGMKIAASNVESIRDELPAIQITVRGTNSADNINFNHFTRQVDVSGRASYSFGQKQILVLTGLEGNDTYSLSEGASDQLQRIEILDRCFSDSDRLIVSDIGDRFRATARRLEAPGRIPIIIGSANGDIGRIGFGNGAVVDVNSFVTLHSQTTNKLSTLSETRTLTFKNRTDAALDGPLMAVFKLPAGVNIADATGTTKNVKPGSTYVRFNLTAGRLEPGASVNLNVIFNFASASARTKFLKEGLRVDLYAGKGVP
jgi:hypothetical protein